MDREKITDLRVMFSVQAITDILVKKNIITLDEFNTHLEEKIDSSGLSDEDKLLIKRQF